MGRKSFLTSENDCCVWMSIHEAVARNFARNEDVVKKANVRKKMKIYC